MSAKKIMDWFEALLWILDGKIIFSYDIFEDHDNSDFSVLKSLYVFKLSPWDWVPLVQQVAYSCFPGLVLITTNYLPEYPWSVLSPAPCARATLLCQLAAIHFCICPAKLRYNQQSYAVSTKGIFRTTSRRLWKVFKVEVINLAKFQVLPPFSLHTAKKPIYLLSSVSHM